MAVPAFTTVHGCTCIHKPLDAVSVEGVTTPERNHRGLGPAARVRVRIKARVRVRVRVRVRYQARGRIGFGGVISTSA